MTEYCPCDDCDSDPENDGLACCFCGESGQEYLAALLDEEVTVNVKEKFD